jgi:hypothetical protein
MSIYRSRPDERRRRGALYFLGRPYSMYADHYDVPLREGRPGPRRLHRVVG